MGPSTLRPSRARAQLSYSACHWQNQVWMRGERWPPAPASFFFLRCSDHVSYWRPGLPEVGSGRRQGIKSTRRQFLRAHHRIGMYLAGILGLCALLHVPALGYVSSGPWFFASEEISIAGWNQEPAGIAPSAPTPKQDPPKPDGSQAAPQGSQPVESAPPAQTSNPPAITPVPSAAPSSGSEKSSPSTPKKHASKKKKRSSGAHGHPPQKKVVRRGSTGEPTTKLAPSITDEQAARQR